MDNIKITTDKKGIMTIVVDTNKNLGPSKSGKSTMIATTKGNQKVDGVVIGLNIYK